MLPGLEKRSRRALRRAPAMFTIVLVTVCGKGDPPEPRAADAPAADTAATIDSFADVDPVALPEGFPADLPIPPDATVVRAEISADPAGSAASASLVTTADADDTLSWYARAFEDAGWEVERAPGAIHAVQGESWAEVRARSPAPGRTEIDARVWKAGR